MNSIKRLAVSLAAVSILPSVVLAEGLERVNLDPSFMLEPGTYAEFGMGQIAPSISAVGALVNVDNVAGTYTATTMAAKTSIGSKIDAGIWYTSQGNGVLIDYGTLAGGLQVNADVSLPTLAGMVRYKLSDSMSVIGGLKRASMDSGSTVSASAASAGIGQGSWTFGSASGTSAVYGIISEIPEIAMRMTVLMESSAAIDVPTTYVQDGVNHTGTTKAPVGDATTISLQTGIAPNTLLFGSLKMSNWKDDQTMVPINGGTQRHQISDYSDGQSYTIGLGRRFNDQLSGRVSYFRDPASDCDAASALAPVCERTSLSLGANYAISDQSSLSVGYSWSQYGDATIFAGTALQSTTTNSSVSTLGVRLSYKF